MTARRHPSAFSLCLAFATTLLACGDSDDPGAVEGSTGTAPADGSSTGSDPTSGMVGSTGEPAGSEGEVGGSQGGSGGASTGDGPAPLGSRCTANADCESQFCYQVGIIGGGGGICSECLTEADCSASTGGGCSPPNPFVDPPTAAFCNEGTLGNACETSEVCEGELECIEVANVPNVIVLQTCSECATSADCDETANESCAPLFDLQAYTGQRSCVVNGTLALGEGCEVGEVGHAQCESGICSVANLDDILQIGICGECAADADCDEAGGEVCLPAELGADFTLTPAHCGVEA